MMALLCLFVTFDSSLEHVIYKFDLTFICEREAKGEAIYPNFSA